ncbi:uncharacterized protein LOC143018293 isoform X3 [Oratosquilla oratoria]|uniref:uncharacterized protein LOC143018293 isoform X3 n=1 Tax=Oratosquilla oratoria TaxID=337810 RepID=UPI003F76222D
MPTVRTLVVCIGLMSVMAGVGKCRIPFHKEPCDRGTKCSQCPEGTFQTSIEDDGVNQDTELVCCPGCANSTMFSSLLPGHPPCYCLISDLKYSRNFRFPETFNTQNDLDASPSQDTNFILNKASKDSHAMQEAFGLIVAALENLDSRLTTIENRFGIPDREFLQTSGSTVNRLGEVESRPCPNANFTRVPITGRCYYMSVINKDRKHWEEARASCQSMEATLAEPRGALFWHVVSFLAKNEKTAGFGFWVGGVYLGNWFWINSGEVVSLDSNFWSYRDNEDIIRPPGDIEGGKCLTLRYVLEEKSYAYTADQCGYTKYYLCEMLEKTHRLYF